MVPSKTYLKFKETRSQEDLETLNSYLKRLSEISDILNGDEDLDNETENKLYDKDEDLTDKTVRLIFPRVKLNPNHLHVYHTKRIISTRKNMPRKSNITLTFSKNQKLFTLSLKILSTFSNPLSNEN